MLLAHAGLAFVTSFAVAIPEEISTIILGAIQGVTEFLPVSSSGHIALGAMLFGLEDAGLTLSIVLHAGTLIATVVGLRKEILELLVSLKQLFTSPSDFIKTDEGLTVLGVIVASVPTAMIGLFLKDRVEAWSTIPWIVGVCLICSAALVLTTRNQEKRHPHTKSALPLKYALLVGIAQGIAVLPGISRSGTTIAVAMMLGMGAAAAFRFSFLLSLPAVLGAVILELTKPGALADVSMATWIGGLVAIVVGYVSLLLLRGVVTQGRLWMFALYLVPAGCLAIAWQFIAS